MILSLVGNKISIDEFRSQFGRNIDSSFVLGSLQRVTNEEDGESLPYLFYLWGYLPEGIEEPHLALMRELLAAKWHDQHEWVVDTLNAAHDVEAIPCLSIAAQAEYPDLDEIDAVSLQKRCVYAMEAIDADKAAPYLRLLAKMSSEPGRVASSLLKE